MDPVKLIIGLLGQNVATTAAVAISLGMIFVSHFFLLPEMARRNKRIEELEEENKELSETVNAEAVEGLIEKLDDFMASCAQCNGSRQVLEELASLREMITEGVRDIKADSEEVSESLTKLAKSIEQMDGKDLGEIRSLLQMIDRTNATIMSRVVSMTNLYPSQQHDPRFVQNVDGLPESPRPQAHKVKGIQR